MSERNSFLESTKESDERLEALRRLYPEIFSDGKINLDAFKDVTGTSNLPEGQDKTPGYYGLYWPGKRAAKQLARKEAEGTLEPVPGDGVNEDSTRNVYIEGDNLEVLRILKQSYKGRVKMIYIDPPYNTGNDFIYPDDYKMPVEEYLRMTGQADEGGKKLVTNVKSGGAFHTNWLNMMYPRLQLARELLTEDGVIFISIDDNEQANLKLLCDDVFGEENFVSSLIWAAGRKNDSKHVSVSHEYILCYFRNIAYISDNEIVWREKKNGLEDIYSAYEKLKKEFGNNIKEIEAGLKAWYKNLPNGHPAKDHSHYNKVDENGIFFASDISWPGGGGPKYEILHPVTHKPVRIPSRGWITNESNMTAWIKEGRVYFGENEISVPTIKSYLNEHEYGVPYSVFYQDGRAASKRLAALMGEKVFENPKDEEVIQRMIEFVGLKKDDIILDFFSGSATTAHSCFLANIEQNMNRKFVLVQLPEQIDPSKAKSE
ncbi:MAG: site-specific DNA-methyltransferase, partial [Treponema sp.]|nr:site-specific DNA-methyltransferase [Treponema sp.]